MSKTMSADNAVRILKEIQDLGIRVTLDGGWGIDALIMSETRAHSDLDILVEKKDWPTLLKYLQENHYKQADNFNKAWHMSFENETTVIDIHIIEFDEVGKAIYGPKIRDDFPFPGIFPAYAFKGVGRINDFEVQCLSAQYRVNCQTRVFLNLMPDNFRHSPDAKDYSDLKLICEKFDIPMPKELSDKWG